MSTSLGATIEQAQVAFDSGDYRSVVASCTRIINQYPHYTAAQRLLGLAYLEQGQSSEAQSCFARLLAHDPRDPTAYLGLGLIAEDSGVIEHALAYCQVAWELAPYESSYREPINRVAEKCYGSDGKLQLTHAALAQIHANASRLRRAIREYQAALTALPDRIDLWMGLAETLWILGENDDAAEIAREFLSDHSELVPALVILTDLERRNGDPDAAVSYRERLHRLDPDGGLTGMMAAKNPQADIDFLLLNLEEQPGLSEHADAIVSERPHFVPAPDFNAPLDQDIEESAGVDDLQPGRPGEILAEMPPIPDEPTISSFVPEPLDAKDHDTVEVDTSEGAIDAALTDDAEPEDLFDDLKDLEPMSLDEFGASDDLPEPEPSGFFEDSEIDFDIKIEDPDAVQIGGTPRARADVSSTGGSLSDTPGVSDESPELPEVEEPDAELELDEADRSTMILPEIEDLDEQVIADESGSGITGLLSELDDEGLAPFDPAGADSEISGEAPAGDEPAFSSLTDGWDEIDAQLAAATPGEDTGDDLLDIDDLGLEPFALDDEDIDQVITDEASYASEDAAPANEASPPDPAGVDAPPWAEQQEGADFESEPPTTGTDRLEITHELSKGSLDPDFERRMAEVEQAARENIGRTAPEDIDEGAEALHKQTSELHANVAVPTAEHLVADAALFERARTAKAGLIEQGIIKGHRELVAQPAADMAVPAEEAAVPPAAPEEVERIEDTGEPTASDLDALREASESDPRNDEIRWLYAEALREQGEIYPAFTEYRWLIRHAPDRYDDIISSLQTCADNDQEADLAHRLLADLYRRRGDMAQARSHASMAMATRRLMRDTRA